MGAGLFRIWEVLKVPGLRGRSLAHQAAPPKGLALASCSPEVASQTGLRTSTSKKTHNAQVPKWDISQTEVKKLAENRQDRPLPDALIVYLHALWKLTGHDRNR